MSGISGGCILGTVTTVTVGTTTIPCRYVPTVTIRSMTFNVTSGGGGLTEGGHGATTGASTGRAGVDVRCSSSRRDSS